MVKLKIGLFFGGRSTEHEISVLTALQTYENLDLSKCEVIPVYVSKAGDFYTNPKFLELKNFQDVESLLLASTKVVFVKGGLKTAGFFGKTIPLDVALLAFHGSFGEDGCVQGLLEMYQIPYTGFNVLASAVAMDKVLSKALFKELGLPVGEYVEVKRADWLSDSKSALKKIQNKLEYPLFIKPATIGSSIGVSKAKDEDSFSFALEVAFTYSEKVVVEEAFEGKIEVNCSALGYEDVKASVCEMPVASEEILSFADKYQRGGGKGSKGAGMAALSRIIPAPISQRLTLQIQEATIKVFKALDGCGVARIDYFVDKKNEKFWINEINSPPGSFAFYLWEKSGIKFSKLLDMLIEYALKRAGNQSKTQYIFESGLLSQMAQKGGVKS
ncbi:D-alanine--D-alanine ligase [Candidatus Daviesbacteria bacterium]|nr:D-alanine--D-alanine ligase [Candidatus Daviesbacteria bacterium]